MSMTIKTPPTKLDVKKDNITKYEGESEDDGTTHGHVTYTHLNELNNHQLLF